MNVLKRVWRRWSKIAAAIGAAQAAVIYTVIYFVVVAPIAVLMRLVSDPLAYRRRACTTFWTPRDDHAAMTLEEARRL
jgi:hypothetical protein